MKKALSLPIALLLALAVVSATNSVIDPEIMPIHRTDIKTSTYCVDNHGVPMSDLQVAITTYCLDRNHIVGCQYPADLSTPPEFSVLALDSATGTDGCAQLQISTDNANGTYYYSVSGSIGGAEVTMETGTAAAVPEFGIIAASMALAGCGLLVWRKREPQ